MTRLQPSGLRWRTKTRSCIFASSLCRSGNLLHCRRVSALKCSSTRPNAVSRLSVLCGKPKETYRTNQTKQTTSNVFCTSKKRKNPKSSSKEMNRKIFCNFFENYYFYKYALVHFLFEILDFGKSKCTNS